MKGFGASGRSAWLSLRSGLLGLGLGLCALVCAAQSAAPAQPSSDAAAAQKSLQQLQPQIGQLKQQASALAALPPGDKSEALKRQIAAIERQQTQLEQQLKALGEPSQQQIEALQSANRSLRLWLGLLAGVIALGLALAWRQSRRARQPDPAAAPEALAAAPDTPHSEAEAAAPAQSPWAPLVAADLHRIEQALTQAREGFMRPERTEF